MNRKQIHEKYHHRTSLQHKVVDKNNFTHRFSIEVIDKYLHGRKKILDIGCGAGTLSFYLASKKHDVLGIDISGKAIEYCEESAKLMQFKNAKFQMIDFPDRIPKGKYDAVIFFEVIEHLEKDEKAIQEIYRLLKPGGYLLLSTPSLNAPLHKLGLTKNFDNEVGHLKRYSVNGMSEMLRRNKFEVEEIKKIEGIIRNFLFVNPVAGKFVRFIKLFLIDIVTYLDNVSLKILGESNFVIVAKRK